MAGLFPTTARLTSLHSAGWHHVGGYGHLLIMGQAGFLEHDDTVHGIRMFAREVYPRLKELYPDTTVSGVFEKASSAAS